MSGEDMNVVDAAHYLRKRLAKYGDGFSVQFGYRHGGLGFDANSDVVVEMPHHWISLSFDLAHEKRPKRATLSWKASSVRALVNDAVAAVEMYLESFDEPAKETT